MFSHSGDERVLEGRDTTPCLVSSSHLLNNSMSFS